MTENELAHPHDLLTRYFLVEPDLTADLLTYYIERRVVDLLDLKKLRCESTVDIDKNLVESIGDIRFSTVFKRTQRRSNVFVFLEHQSKSDRLMGFRALEYIVKAYRQYLDNAETEGTGQPKSFPYPIVVVLYHGKRPWGKLLRMADLIDSVPELAKEFLDFFPLFLIDLSQLPPEQFKGHPALVALLETLQLASEGKLETGFDRVTGRLTAVRNDPRATGWMHALVRYTLSMCRIGRKAIIDAFTKILDEEEAQKMAMSTAQELRAEGMVEGEAKGEAKAIVTVLKARFGSVPQETVERISAYTDLVVLNSLTSLAATCETLAEFQGELR